MAVRAFGAALAAEIRAEQGRQKLTGSELAHRMGRATSTVSRWLAGTSPMTVDDVAAFGKALGVRTADLVERAMGRLAPDIPPAARRDVNPPGSGNPKVTSAEILRMPSITLLPRAA